MKKMYYFLLFVMLFVPFLMGPLCDGGGDTGDTTPTQAYANLSVKYPTSYSTVMECTSRLIWTFTPGTLTGSEGQSNAFTLDQDYSSSTNAEHNCFFTENVSGLKAGTWTVQVSNGYTWLTSCIQTLENGTNVLKFTVNRAGCTTGLTPYPGD